MSHYLSMLNYMYNVMSYVLLVTIYRALKSLCMFFTEPHPVVSLQCINKTTSSLALEWEGHGGCQYEVTCQDEDGTERGSITTAENRWEIDNLLSGHVYTFVVKSNKHGEISDETSIEVATSE